MALIEYNCIMLIQDQVTSEALTLISGKCKTNLGNLAIVLK